MKRALVVAHWKLAEPAIGVILAELGACRVDLLAYGSGAQGLASHSLGDVLTLPSSSDGWRAAGRSLWELTRALRRHRYESVMVAHPGLRVSRARGLLLAFPHLARSKRVLAMDSPKASPTPVGRDEALVDLLRWLVVQIMCSAIAAVATVAVDAIARRTAAKRPLAPSGRVVYLRTDLDLVDTPLLAGGSLAHTLGIVDALRRRGYQVDVWSTGVVKGIADTRIPAFLRANWPTEVAELLSGLRQAYFGLRAPMAGAFVYQRYSLNNLAGMILARRWGVPLVLEANGSEVQWRQEWSTLRYVRLCAACERLLLCFADRVVVVSSNARQHLIQAGADPNRVRIVPNGVDPDRFATAAPRRLGLEPDSFVIAFCGLFYRWHGVATLAEAFVRLRDSQPRARLLLIGQGEEEARVRRILQVAGAEDDCLLPGIVPPEDVPGYLAAADVVVSPHADLRNFIGSPIKIFEYMASGRPIVASRLAQLAEILTDEETALLVPPGEPIALAAALERLMTDPDLRHRLGACARREAVARHSWDARLEEILTGALPSPAPAPAIAT